MCVGVPMRVIETGPGVALCEGAGGRREAVDVALVGEPPLGAWLLVFLGAAREILSEQQADEIAGALRAVELALQGETNLDHLFPGLAGREPQLPAFLRKAEEQEEEKDKRRIGETGGGGS